MRGLGLKLYQVLNFDISFQKNNIRSRNKNVDFYHWVIFRRNSPVKKFKSKLPQSFWVTGLELARFTNMFQGNIWN